MTADPGKRPWSGVWDGKVVFHEKVKDFVNAIREGRGAPIPASKFYIIIRAIIDGVLRSSELKREVEITLP